MRQDMTPLSLEYIPEVGVWMSIFGQTKASKQTNIIFILTFIGVCISILQTISAFSTGRMSLYASILKIPYFIVYVIIIFMNEETYKWSLSLPYMFNTFFTLFQLIGVASTYECNQWYTCL